MSYSCGPSVSIQKPRDKRLVYKLVDCVGTETPLDPGRVQGVELVHGVTRTGLVCDTLYVVSFEGQEFAGQLRLAKHALSGLLN